MKYLVPCLMMIVLSVASVVPGRAQSLDKNIKDAKSKAVSGVTVGNQKKLPDSLVWKKGGTVNTGFSQTHYSNWAGGGENTLSLNSTLGLFANYKKDKIFWENNAFFAYGVMKKGEAKAVKNDDQIKIGSRTGYQMAKNWYYSAAFLTTTQFTPGYKYSSTDTTRTSDFLAPVSVFLSLGMDYKPSSRFAVSLSPLMGKATYVRSDDSIVMITAGLSQELIDRGKRSRYEFGGGAVVELNGNFFEKKVTYNTRLELFSNYLEKPQNVDIYWDFQFRMALTRHVSAGVRVNMIYDDDQKIPKEVKRDNKTVTEYSPRLQVKEFFEIGLFYDF